MVLYQHIPYIDLIYFCLRYRCWVAIKKSKAIQKVRSNDFFELVIFNEHDNQNNYKKTVIKNSHGK